MRTSSGAREESAAIPAGRAGATRRCAHALGLAAVVAAVGLGGVLAFSPAVDGDLWWHLATGRWILGGRGIPHADPFTFTALGRPWVTHEWLSGVLFELLHRLGGIDLLVAFKSLLAAAALAVSAHAGLAGAATIEENWSVGAGRTCASRSARFPSLRAYAGAALGALLGAVILAPRAFARPHMLTALFLAVLILFLRLEARTGRRIWRLLLIPLFLVWANVHSGFVLGFAWWLLAWAGEWISAGTPAGEAPFHPGARRRERGLCLLLAFCASLVNPHFLQAHLYPFHLIAREEVRANIVELRSVFHPAYRDALFPKAIAVSWIAVLACAAASRPARGMASRPRGGERAVRLDLALLLPGAFFALLGALSVRGSTEYAVVLPALLGGLANRTGSLHARPGDLARTGALARPPAWVALRRAPLAGVVCVAVLALSIAGATVAATRGLPVGQGVRQGIGSALPAGSVPVSAARLLREAPRDARIFNLLSYGGFLIHELGPERKVFIDGRLDVFAPGLLTGYARMLEDGTGWREAVDRWNLSIAVVNHVPHPERDRGVRALLRDDPAWTCVLDGDHALLYARRIPENEPLLNAYGVGFDPGARHEDFIGRFLDEATPEEVSRTLASLARMRPAAPAEVAPPLHAAQILERLGRSREAAAHAREAMRRDPRARPLRFFLAEVLQRADSLDAARCEIRTLLAEEPRDGAALALLGLIERASGRPAEALRALEAAAALAPADPVVLMRLGAVEAEVGRLAPARRHLEAALRLRPGDPAAIRNLRALEILEAGERTGAPPAAGEPPALR